MSKAYTVRQFMKKFFPDYIERMKKAAKITKHSEGCKCTLCRRIRGDWWRMADDPKVS